MSEEGSNEMDKTPGIFSWNELMTRDAAASAKFYTELFGWSREEMDMQGYTYSMFKSGDRAVCGMFTLPPDAESMPGHVDALRDRRRPRSIGGSRQGPRRHSSQGNYDNSDGEIRHPR